VEKAPPYPIRSVDNALRLQLLIQRDGSLRVSTAASELGVARSTAPRLRAAVHRSFRCRAGTRQLQRARLAGTYNAVLGFAFGWAIELSRQPGDADGNWNSDFEQALTRLNSLVYPALARDMPDLMNRTFLLRWDSGKERQLDGGFELALASLLDGLRRSRQAEAGNE
jgi:hypothetical protein